MANGLPPGPRQPVAVQTLGWWTRPLGYVHRWRRKFGKRFTLRLVALGKVVVLSDPEDVKALFAASPDDVRPGEGATKILGGSLGPGSLLLLDGDEHLRQRRLLLPSFHGERLQRLAEMMENVAEQEIAAWPRDEPTALYPRLLGLTVEMILRAIFGLEPGSPQLKELRSGLAEALEANGHIMAVLPQTQRHFGGHGPWARFKAAQDRNDALITDLIETRRREGSERDDVLSVLLGARYEDGTAMSDRELLDQLMTLAAAGHETSASALAWAFEHLSHAPAVLDELTAEIDRDDGDAYLTATLQEVLRCHPAIPCIPRKVKRETQIGDWTYPPGVLLLAEQHLIHHDPEIYGDPFVFRPERFVEQPPGTYTWIPFGGGMRRCIGASFAMLEMKIALRTALRVLRPRPVGAHLDRSGRRYTLIVPQHGTRVALSRRIQAAAAA